MKTPEKKLSRSNTWDTWKKKLRQLGYAGALSSVLLLSSCGTKDSDVTKLSKQHDVAVENIKTQEKELKNAEQELKDAQKKVEQEKQDVIDAKKEEIRLKDELKQESKKL